MNEEIMAAEAGKPARTLEQVTEEIRYLDNQAKRLVLGHAIEIGRRLEEAKALVPYGEWGNYIEKELSYSQSTANNFMRIFDEYGAAQQSLFGPVADSQTLGNLSYTKALKLLAVPREEREAFAQEVDAEHISTRELEAAIRERDEARKALEEAERQIKIVEAREEAYMDKCDRNVDFYMKESLAFEKKNAQLEKELAELKARPVEVAVQQPDPETVEKLAEKRAEELAKEARDEAEIERRAAASAQKAQAEAEQAAVAAKAEAKQKIKKAKEQARAEREKLEGQLKEAEEKLAAAGTEDKAEADRLRAETEQLRKQLAMSNQATVVFKLRFMAWQQAHQQMSEAFTALDEETKEKMRAAIRAQVKSWGWTDE